MAEHLTELANILCLHTAAMKPSYFSVDELPQSVKDRVIEE